MLMRDSRTYRLAQPICIHSPFYFLEPFITEIVQPYLGERIACIVLIYSCQSLELKLFAGIHKIVVAQVCQGQAVIAFV